MKSIKTKAKILLIVMSLAVFFVVGCSNKDANANPKDVVAKVENQVITKDEYNKRFELMKKNVEAQYGEKIWSMEVEGKTYLQNFKESLLDQIIDETAIKLYMVKENQKIDEKDIDKQYKTYMDSMKDNKDVQKFMKDNKIDDKFLKNQLTTEMYMQKFQQKMMAQVTDDTLKKYYDAHIKEYDQPSVRASHILLKDEKSAKAVLEELKKGADFSKLAKEKSTGPSAPNGGDLGYFTKGKMVPEFEKGAFNLEVGQISDIVKTQFGYHIIKLTDKKDKMSFEDVKQEIAMQVIPQMIKDEIKKIKSDIKIEKHIDHLK